MLKKIVIKKNSRIRRKKHIRKHIFGSLKIPRLSIFKSNKHIYIQAIDDHKNNTIASFSTISKYFKVDFTCTKTQLSFIIGLAFGKKLQKIGIKKGRIDRNGFHYSNRLSNLVDGIRKSGFYV
jgi:large subunit ribosomal protein L18